MSFRPSLRTAFVALLLPLLLPVPATAQPSPSVTDDERASVVEQIETLLADRYVFADRGVEAGALVRSRLDAGAYDDLSAPDALADALTSDLQSVTDDKHLRVRHRPSQRPASAPTDPLLDQFRSRERMRSGNYGVASVEVLEGNVGYLDLRFFPPEEDVRDTYDAAMRLLANVNALIIDERQHGGGSPSGVRYLSSYFFDEPTHLNSLHWRDGDEEQIDEFWTLDEVGGPQRPDLPVFVLTSDYTFSGAEEFAYNLKTRDRATIVGETSGGGANPGGTMPAGDRFVIFVPTGRAVNPITGTNWEGVGVAPDVAVPAEEALDRAHQLAQSAAEAYEQRRERETIDLITSIRSRLDQAADTFEQGADATGEVHAVLQDGADAQFLGEGSINALGYDYLARQDHAMATAIFQYNVERFPESWNVYDSLGESYAEQGKQVEAIASYRRARALAPADQHERIDAILSQL